MKQLITLFFGLSALTACSTGEFTGTAETAIDKKCHPSEGKNCKEPPKSLDQETLVIDDEGSIEGKCKFTDINVESDGFLIPGGPPIKIKPQQLRNGVTEGDMMFVDLNAYQGPAGAGGAKSNKNFAATLHPDGSVLTPAKIPTFAPHIIPATFGAAWHQSNEWSLTAFPQRSGQVPVAIKHEYRIQIKSVNTANCQILAHRVIEPYYTRGPNFYDPTKDYDTGGCFALSTKIKMFDGTEKLAVNVERGDRLLNPVTKKSVTVSEVVYGPEENLGLIMVGIGDNTVKVTTQHPFETQKGLKSAADLTIDDKILTSAGKYQKLTILKVLPPAKNQRVINFIVSSNSKKPIDHMVLADGVVTGDLYLQRKLSRQLTPKLQEKSPAVAFKN
jgi:hypothetical protein